MIDRFQWEASQIIILTSQAPTAVIELANLLEVPIGVVRVLVGDLAEMGLVAVSNPAAQIVAQGGAEYTALLERVLDGIKEL
jgi:hypothetical protein